ncbi:hypothetical protein ACT7DZ_13015 [Bacillus cereus]
MVVTANSYELLVVTIGAFSAGTHNKLDTLIIATMHESFLAMPDCTK